MSSTEVVGAAMLLCGFTAGVTARWFLPVITDRDLDAAYAEGWDDRAAQPPGPCPSCDPGTLIEPTAVLAPAALCALCEQAPAGWRGLCAECAATGSLTERAPTIAEIAEIAEYRLVWGELARQRDDAYDWLAGAFGAVR